MMRRFAFSKLSLLLCYAGIVATAADKATTLGAGLRGIEHDKVDRSICANRVLINFDTAGNGAKLKGGDYVSKQWLTSQGVTISGSGSGPQIFNSSHPGTITSLGSPNSLCSSHGPGIGAAGGPTKTGKNCVALGNILYVAGKYYTTRTFHFEFSQLRTVQTIGVLDIKQGGKVSVHVETANGKIEGITTAGLGDNAYQVINIYRSSVKAISVSMSTGAITHVEFCGTYVAPKPSAPVAPKPSKPSPVAPKPSKPSPVAAPHVAVSTLTPSTCNHRNYIGFEISGNGTKLSGGKYVKNEWLNVFGVSISAFAMSDGFTPNAQARLFDTSKPGDILSLGSPNKLCSPSGPGVGVNGGPGQPGQNCVSLGKVLIAQRSSVSTPDPVTGGAVFTFSFSNTKTVLDIGLLNVPAKDTAIVTVTLATGSKKLFYTRGRGTNGYQTVTLGVHSATKLTVYLPTTGAVTHVDLCGGGIAIPSKAPVSVPVLGRADSPSPASIPVDQTPAPSPYATVDDNGMFPPIPAPIPTSTRIGTTEAPTPYATVDDNGMFPPIPAPIPTSTRIETTDAPTPYATADDAGMIRPVDGPTSTFAGRH